MLTDKEEKIVVQSMKSLTLELLKDLIGEEQASELGGQLDNNVAKIFAKMHESEKIPEELKKLISDVEICESEEKMAANIRAIVKKENLSANDEHTAFEAVKNRLEAFNDCKLFVDELSNKIKNYQHNEILSSKDLNAALTEFFKDKMTNKEELKNSVDAIENQFLTEYKAAKDYYKVRESITLFACRTLLNSKAHQEEPDLIHLGCALDEYRDAIDEKYTTIYNKLTVNFLFNLAEIMTKLDQCENTYDSFKRSKKENKFDLVKHYRNNLPTMFSNQKSISDNEPSPSPSPSTSRLG
ncbi:hypothetical protein [Legionella sp.]|uniref:hypothetical protein n=1 Tax=Legionella sp. TaxID=459 RepID=UPI003C9654E2